MSENISMKQSLRVLAMAGLLAGALGAGSAQAELALKGGVNLTDAQITGETYQTGLGYQGGFGVTVGKGRVGAGLDVLFAQRQLDGTGGQLPLILQDVEVPVFLMFNFHPVFLTFGGYYSFGVGQVRVGSTRYGYTDAELNESDYGLNAGLGIRLRRFQLEGRYAAGLYDRSTRVGREVRFHAIDLLAGLYF